MGIFSTIMAIVQIITLATGIKGWRQARKLQKKGQDILATKTADGGKIPVIYGTRRVGSTLLYMDTDSGNSKELFVVYGLSVGEVDNIDLESIEINGVSIKDAKVFRDGYYAGSDKIASGAGSLCTASQIGKNNAGTGGQSGTDPTKRYRMVFNAHHGSSTQTADPMLNASLSKWTSAHRLRGIAYIAASFEYDSRGMFSSTPELTVNVRGKKLYDPRLDGSISGGSGDHRIDDPSTFEWSDNAALALLDYVTNDEYGKGLAASLVNMQSFQTAADTADELVDIPEYAGSYSATTFSGTSGNNYIDVDSSTWNKIKTGVYLSLRDSADDNEYTDVPVTDVQRFRPHTESFVYRIFLKDVLTSTYTDEGGTTRGKVKRFHCNGVIDTNENILENTRDLLSNIRGFFNYLNGQYHVLIEDTGSSVFSITDDHIVSEESIKIQYEDKEKKYNKVIVNYFNGQKKYEADTVTVFHDPNDDGTFTDFADNDGGEILEAKVEFDFITNPYIAYNMGYAILGRSRNQKTISFLATPQLFRLSVGDIVDITYAGLGLSGDFYRIEAINLLNNGLLNIQAIEYINIYDWDDNPPEDPIGEDPDLPTGTEALPPTNLSFTDSNASATGRPYVTWTENANSPAKEFRANCYTESGGSIGDQVFSKITSTEFVDLNFLPVNDYQIQVSTITTTGSESDPASLNFSIADQPVTVPDLGFNIGGFFRYEKTGNVNAPTTNQFNTEFGRDPIEDDMVIVIQTDATEEPFSQGYIYNGTSFDTVDNFIAGDLLIDGTLGADKIVAKSISSAQIAANSINGGKIKASTTITAGSGETVAKMSGISSSSYRMWAGSAAAGDAPFQVETDGTVSMRRLKIYKSDGTLIFDSDTGFDDEAFSEIGDKTNTRVQTVTKTLASDSETLSVSLVENSTLEIKVKLNTAFSGYESSSDPDITAGELETAAVADIPNNFTLTLKYSDDNGSSYSTLATQQFTRVDSGTPTSVQYLTTTDTEISDFSFSIASIVKDTGCVDTNFLTIITDTEALTGTTGGTTYLFKSEVSTSDGSYDSTRNKVTSSASRTITVTDTTGDGFYVSDGDATQDAPTGDITSVSITAGDGLDGTVVTTAGAHVQTLDVDSTVVRTTGAQTIAGNKTFSNNVIVSGDLTVNGTTTTVNTSTLDVKDKNITVNYGTGDTSASADGAGLTIQDAVNASNDATLTWDSTFDRFDFSHAITATTADANRPALLLTSTPDAGNNQLLVLNNDNDRDIGITFRNQGVDKWTLKNDAPTATTGDDFLIVSASGTALTIDQDGTTNFTGSVTSASTVTATGGNSTQWNTAYGWGDHAAAGYLETGDNISVGNIEGSGTFTLSDGISDLTISQTTNDWYILSAQQNNGLVIYNGTGGVEMYYNNAAVQEWDSVGGTNIISGGLSVGGTEVIDSSRNVDATTIEVGSTTVIDASRNITGEAISSNGILNVGNATNTGRNMLEIQTGSNTLDRGLSFKNSGGAYSNSIFAEDVGGNESRLVFTGGNSSATITNLSRDFMIDNASGGGDGDIHARGDVVAFSSSISSDARLKYDIEDIQDPIEIIKTLKGRNFKWKRNGEQTSGVIAQEVEESAMSFLVSEKVDIENPDEKIKRVKYDGFIGLLIEAIKDQQKQIDELKAKLNGDS
jgi:hypothetical protein